LYQNSHSLPLHSSLELHASFLERLEGAKHEVMTDLDPIVGIHDLPLPTFSEAMQDVHKAINGLVNYEQQAITFATNKAPSSLSASTSSQIPFTVDEIAAIHIYTVESDFYRKLNAFLREERTHVASVFKYLRLFFHALGKLPPFPSLLYRGVAKDLRKHYRQV
jgi:hypothetical protein